MGFYNDRVLPRIIDVMCGTRAFAKVRGAACEGLAGDVLEIGFGSGLNLAHLPPEVTGLWAVEPAGRALELAAPRIAASPVPVTIAGLDGAHLDLPDDRFDAALSTMTLCTIPDVSGALREVYRVLRPGGVLHFAEHGIAPHEQVARWQYRCNGLQGRIGGGCHLDRDIAALIADAGFEITELENFYLKGGPKPWSYMYLGRARTA